MLLVNRLLVLSAWCLVTVNGCLPTEFPCESGQCIDGARFCDGTMDCADGTDEHHGCTNCNRTYYGMAGIKYSLRLNEPVRQSGSMCSLSFIASGGIYGDFVEITFLSFHIGVFQLERSMCYRGYMEVEDNKMYPLKKRSARYLGRSRKKGASPRKENHLTTERSSSVGSFCGKMIGKSATFYSYGDKVNLNIFMSSHLSGHSAAPRLYLTYRFLQLDGEQINARRELNDNCDVIFRDCHNISCVIRSPNYPGFYLRNLTCYYRVLQDTVPEGYLAQIELYQPNEFKIDVLNGASNDRYKSGVLTSDCAGDKIRVYDGKSVSSPLLADFCGSGPLPVIRSSGPEMLVELISVPFQPLTTSRFELDVQIHFVQQTVFRVASDLCSANVDAGRSRTGIIKVPEHSIAANTTCTFRISGRKPSDRIWLYFVVYSVPDLHPWVDREHCDVARLRILYPKLKLRHPNHRRYHQKLENSMNSSHLIGTFCEKTSPMQCGHASDFEDFVPSRPCSAATESYLSTGPELLLELTFSKAMAVHGVMPHFVARYELVDADHVMTADACSVRVRSMEGTSGYLENPHNLFLYGRGGSKNLTCRYELIGKEYERIRIVVQKIDFVSSPCETLFHQANNRHSCALPDRRTSYALINVTETWKDLTLPVGCVCSENVKGSQTDALVFESIGSQMDMTFVVRNMGPRDDFRTFQFEVMYEFVPNTGCDVNDYVMTGIEGRVTLDAPHKTRCRFLFVSLPSRALYVTVQGRDIDESCQNKYLFYDLHYDMPFAAYCASGDIGATSFFTRSLSKSSEVTEGYTNPGTGLTLMEVIAEDPVSFNVHWIEVTRRSTNYAAFSSLGCGVECPELEACISSDLSCDGINHCPQTAADESPERCDKFPVITIVSSAAAAGVVLVLSCLIGLFLRQHFRRKSKTSVPHLQASPMMKGPRKELAI